MMLPLVTSGRVNWWITSSGKDTWSMSGEITFASQEKPKRLSTNPSPTQP